MWTLVAFRGGLDSDEALPNAGVIIAPYPFMAQARCWLAWHDGEPAGAATLAIHDGVAGLFGASTRVPHRNRGVQHALIAARLAAAAERAAILRPSTPSQAAIRSATSSGWGSGWRIRR